MKVLQVVHGLPPRNVAGSELYTAGLLETLADRFAFAVFKGTFDAPERAHGEVSRYRHGPWPVTEVACNRPPGRQFALRLRDPEAETAFSRMLAEERPVLIHFQHLINLPLSLPEIARAHGIPYLLHLHDYYYLCDRIQLLRPDLTVCPGPDGGDACVGCRAVFDLIPGAATEFAYHAWPGRLPEAARGELTGIWTRARSEEQPHRRHWRNECRQRLACCRELVRAAATLIAPSAYVRDRYVAAGFAAGGGGVLPYGVPEVREPAGCGARGNGPLRCVFLGPVHPHKGLHILIEAMNELVGLPLELAVYGYETPDYLHACRQQCVNSRVFFRGSYSPEALPGILHDADAVLVPSLWEETLGIVIREAHSYRVPVVAARIGAIPESVRHGENGLLLPPGDVAAWRTALRGLAERPQQLHVWREHIRMPLTVRAHADRLAAIYAAAAGAVR